MENQNDPTAFPDISAPLREKYENTDTSAGSGMKRLLERMNNSRKKNCERCGEEFNAQPEDTTCAKCGFLEANPEFQPMRWIWAAMGREWGISSVWPDKEPWPEVGDTVTAHRKDGTKSQATIGEVVGLRAYSTIQIKLYCRVTNSRPFNRFPDPPVKE